MLVVYVYMFIFINIRVSNRPLSFVFERAIGLQTDTFAGRFGFIIRTKYCVVEQYRKRNVNRFGSVLMVLRMKSNQQLSPF